MVVNDILDPMLTTGEVARMLNVHVNTVRKWSNQGILESYRISSRGDRRFKKEDIDNFFTKDYKGGVRSWLNPTKIKVR